MSLHTNSRHCTNCKGITRHAIGTAGRVCHVCLKFTPKGATYTPPSPRTLFMRRYQYVFEEAYR